METCNNNEKHGAIKVKCIARFVGEGEALYQIKDK